jgi:hypothetical protein
MKTSLLWLPLLAACAGGSPDATSDGDAAADASTGETGGDSAARTRDSASGDGAGTTHDSSMAGGDAGNNDAAGNDAAGNDAGVPYGVDQLDISHVTVINSPPDTPTWPITTAITELDLDHQGPYINFTKRNGFDSWPDTPAGLQYTLWIVENIGGTWYASGGIPFWRGLPYNGGSPAGYAANWFYNGAWAPMNTHQPAVGEMVGFFVAAGNERYLHDDSGTLVKERSNVVLVSFPPDTGAVFFEDWPCGGLPAGGSIGMGQSIHSCDGRFLLTMQNAGDLALTMGASQLWDDGQNGHSPGVNLVMQDDGNLVSYFNEGSNGGPIWNSGTVGHPGASLVLQNDGNMVVSLNGTPLWSTGTGGH